MNKIRVIVDSMSLQGDGNIAVSLTATNNQPLPAWEAGAHIDVYLPNHIIRQYSLVGDCHDLFTYTVCIKKDLQSRGGSRFIHEQLRVGHELDISQPRNIFRLQDAAEYYLIAGGIGITPILAMAEHLEQQQKPFHVLYYIKHQAQIAFKKRLQQQFQHGDVQILCSDAGQSLREDIAEILKAFHKNQQVYLCGPQGFMDSCIKKLLAHGWTRENIFLEAFAPVAPAHLEHSGIENAETFQVKLNSTGQIFTVPQEKSIATVLIDNQINVPLSCEMGMCGACLTRVIDGEVDHQDTVQTEDEKSASQQYIALCCSRAKSPMLEIDL
ncbi:oxidoreductase [Acinetobacter qingfengensis]|uniref:Uncharacterized protein n=1 Tax=Acinetobacter qingfengensis TaxID=1262585 RepID=A0A1E7R544_9GAMM|nr:PDR/VanB family oxidoreductase [Acinetobacter qingfengensis]KAA8732441.1 oxidoreductase [Acinetobacter qingfengensis]OEY94436.1 hypothetical protein BJI46_03590 [Acinetobacter qingfengensis]